MDRTITEYPKMGTEPARLSRVPSAESLRGDLVPRRAYTSMVQDVLGRAGARRNVHERLGHVGAVQVRHSYQNAAEASATQRNVYTVPNKAGLRDFWAKRQYGQTMQ